ncbi:MAG: AMP-binding protein, partial [Caulobacteraceae bacterium]|nr:AMP-binding protein [Caulobacter sp.]
MNPADLTLVEHLNRHVRARAHKPFVVLYEGESFRVLTYGELHARSLAWAGRLRAAAVEPGRRVVAIVLPHALDIYPAFLGAMRAGFLPTLLAPPSPKKDPQLHWAAHRALFERIRPAAAVAWEGCADTLAEIAAETGTPLVTPGSPRAPAEEDAQLAPGRAALLQHSSGTTGLKKGVVLSHAHLGAHADMLAQRLKLDADSIVASWLPLYHDMGLVTGFLMPLVLGASVVTVDPFAWAADPCSILRLADRHRATASWAPNFAFAHMARARDPAERFDLSSLRALVSSSEPCRPETMRAFMAAFADSGLAAGALGASYAMAETVFAVTQTPPGQPPRVLRVDPDSLERDGVVAPLAEGPARARAFLSCGAPLPGVRVRIEGVSGPGRTGEILVRSRTLFAGYHAAPELDAEALGPDGWLRTGDIGFLQDGELYVCGRSKELIIVHGRNLYAGDVEAVAGAVSGVKPGRAAALGVVDEETGGEECVLMVEAQEGALSSQAQAELARAVRERVEAALGLHVRRVLFAPAGALVKSTSGKMSRAENLRRLQALDDAAAAGDAPPEGEQVPLVLDRAEAEPPARGWWRRRFEGWAPRRRLE